MRIAELADLTGTTVRTVRHYHALGLLPVPHERGGWRDYDLVHVARLIRIRWLAEAGVPLGRIAQVLDAEPRPGVEASRVVADLEAAAAAADEHLAELARQRELLSALLERARQGLSVSLTPPRILAFYDRLEAAAPDERTRAAVRRERDVVDLACYRGELPPEAEFLYPEPSAGSDAAALAAFGRHVAELSEAEIERTAAANVARIEGRLGDRARDLARRVDIDAVRRIYHLMLRAEPGYQRLGRAMERHLVAAVVRWRQS